jgi:hypothetical protein
LGLAHIPGLGPAQEKKWFKFVGPPFSPTRLGQAQPSIIIIKFNSINKTKTKTKNYKNISKAL